MSIDYYAVSHTKRRAVAVTDGKGNPINRACWAKFMIEVVAQVAEDDPIVLLPDYAVPEDYERCGGEWGSKHCDECSAEDAPGLAPVESDGSAIFMRRDCMPACRTCGERASAIDVRGPVFDCGHHEAITSRQGFEEGDGG